MFNMESSAFFLDGSSSTRVKEVLLHYPLPIIYRRLFVSSDNGHRSIVGRLLLVRPASNQQSFRESPSVPFAACYIALFVFAPGTHYEAGNATQHNPLGKAPFPSLFHSHLYPCPRPPRPPYTLYRPKTIRVMTLDLPFDPRIPPKILSWK